jgi:hypothetical protein
MLTENQRSILELVRDLGRYPINEPNENDVKVLVSRGLLERSGIQTSDSKKYYQLTNAGKEALTR